MSETPAGLFTELACTKSKLDEALAASRAAEAASMTALAEFERLWIVLEGSRRAPISAVATPIQPLAVSRAEAGRLLSRKRTAVWRLIKKGLLDLTADDQVTMESIRRCAAARKAS